MRKLLLFTLLPIISYGQARPVLSNTTSTTVPGVIGTTMKVGNLAVARSGMNDDGASLLQVHSVIYRLYMTENVAGPSSLKVTETGVFIYSKPMSDIDKVKFLERTVLAIIPPTIISQPSPIKK